jgi:hypothetical protein
MLVPVEFKKIFPVGAPRVVDPLELIDLTPKTLMAIF